jgi:hypothetical protein
MDVAATGHVVTPPPAQADLTKMLVAIHGIGDQTAYATVQAVAAQLGNYYDIGAPIPLGRFYQTGAENGGPAPILMVAPPDPTAFVGFGFAEAYWARIPRGVADEKYVLEETKRWARTVIGRLVLRAQAAGQPLPDREQDRLATVLDELIETIMVLQRLNFLAAKAGLFEFKLQQLLTDYVNDVQVVADFPAYREKILATVDQVMTAALKVGGGDRTELYVVAHSEGSVVAFLSLLMAISDPAKHTWIRSVRGLMTIGSPIETHHLLWPELWHGLRPAQKSGVGEIRWCNYYDHGDPIAYPLTATKEWLKTSGFDRHLKPEDIGFARAYLPGKAHNDYWKDRGVFSHFIETVVRAPRARVSMPAVKPKTKAGPWFVSYALPYFLIVALLWLATYFLYRPVVALVATSEPSAVTLFTDVLGLAALLLGITVAARIPRLTNGRTWWVVAAGVLGVSMVSYAGLVSDGSRQALGDVFITGLDDPTREATIGVLYVATAVTLVAGVVANWKPSWGVRILPVSGLLAAVALLLGLVLGAERDIEIWPMVLGALAFFYLWWVAALLFDLVFVWHRFVRHSTASASLKDICEKGYAPTHVEKVVAQCGNAIHKYRVQRAHKHRAQ